MYIKINESNKVVKALFTGTPTTSGWIEIDKLPEVPEVEGKVIVYYYNDGVITWEYEDIPEPPVPPQPEPPQPSREELIHQEIRQQYTENDEFMIMRQYAANPSNPAFATRFNEYNTFVEEVLAKYPEENEMQ